MRIVAAAHSHRRALRPESVVVASGVVGFGVQALAGWPGWLGADGLAMWSEATSGEISDGYPPMLTWLWSWLQPEARGPLLPFGPARLDPVQRAWRKFLRRLKKAGLTSALSRGAMETAALAGQRLPAQTIAVRRIAELYTLCRYAPGTPPVAELRRLAAKAAVAFSASIASTRAPIPASSLSRDLISISVSCSSTRVFNCSFTLLTRFSPAVPSTAPKAFGSRK